MSYSYERIKNFEIGEVFYECESGINIESRVLTKPVETFDEVLKRNQLRWEAENTQNNEKISYLVTENMTHYGPRLYAQPEYIYIKDGKTCFKLLGEEK